MAKKATKQTAKKKPTVKATAKKPAQAKPKTTKAKTTAKKTAVKKATAKATTASGRDAAVTKQRGSFATGKTSNQRTGKDAGSSVVIAKFLTDLNKPTTRRSPNNPEIPLTFIQGMDETFTAVRDELEAFSAHLRSLDRKRLNGVGMKKLGFITRAL